MKCGFGCKPLDLSFANSMIPPLMQRMRSRWFVLGTHLGLWCVLYLAVSHLGGKTPEFRIGDTSVPPSPGPVPTARMDSLFSSAQWTVARKATNVTSPFFTTYFVPPPSPTPPAPTTRKVDVTYQGYYETGDEIKHVVVKVGESFIVASVGAPVSTNLFVANATLQNLLLTNQLAETNVLTLNAKKEIEVPIK